MDHRTDLYSLGVTFYETLAGKPLRPALYEALSTVNETIPPQIDDLIMGCLEDKRLRIDSARTFSSQLEGALKLPSKPLSEVLAHGKLHEIAISLEALTAEGVASLPAGQRDLLIAKIADILSSSDPALEYPCASFLEMMLTRGLFLPRDDFREIVAPSIRWGFERVYEDGRVGRSKIREALEEAAFTARGQSFDVLSEGFIAFVDSKSFDDRDNWFLQGLREILTALMANPSCAEASAPLKVALRAVNKVTRERRFS